MARTMRVPCRRDLACYRDDGHAGDHAYATPDTVPTPAPNWQAGYDAGYREAQEDIAAPAIEAEAREGYVTQEDCLAAQEAINAVHMGIEKAMSERIAAIPDEAVAAYRRDLAERVRGLRVRASVRNETPWQEGFRQSRNETVDAVIALIEGDR